MILRRNKSTSAENNNRNKYKKAKELTAGVMSGSILGAAGYKLAEEQYRKDLLQDYLKEHPEKIKNLELLGKNNSKRVASEVCKVITPDTVGGMKKYALVGAGVGGVITGVDMIKKHYRSKKVSPNRKNFSQKPDDWNENDEKYVQLVERAKRRQKRLIALGKNPNAIYATAGTAIGLISGYKKGKFYKSIDASSKAAQKRIGKLPMIEKYPVLSSTISNAAIGGAVGYGVSNIGNHLTSITTKGKYPVSDPERLEKMAKNERKATDRVLSRYRNMKTAEEREQYRRKLGVKF